MKIEVGFSYGALSGELEKQANKQGFTFGNDAEFVERLRKAYIMGCFYFLTDKQKDMAIKKVHKETIKYLKPLNNSLEE